MLSKVTKEQKELVIKYANEGLGTLEISKLTGVFYGDISNIKGRKRIKHPKRLTVSYPKLRAKMRKNFYFFKRRMKKYSKLKKRNLCPLKFFIDNSVQFKCFCGKIKTTKSIPRSCGCLCGISPLNTYKKLISEYKNKLYPFRCKIDGFFRNLNKIPQNYKINQKVSINTKIRVKLIGFLCKYNNHSDNKEARMLITEELLKEISNKIGENPKCYLTGDKIDLKDSRSYHFDHIIPRAKGGQNTVENLGIATKIANQSKTEMTVDEYIQHCIKVLNNFGYKVTSNISEADSL